MMMDCGGAAMMIGMGVVWLLVVAVLILGLAALVKYLRAGSGLSISRGGGGELSTNKGAMRWPKKMWC